MTPKHDGGAEDGPLVICTLRDHARAHFLRHRVYGKTYDLCAYYGLVKKTNEKVKLIQEQIVQTNRERGNGPFSQKWQKEMANRPRTYFYFREHPEFAKEMAKKGGAKGGKTMTPKKNEVLQQLGKNVGTHYGRIGGIRSQNEKTKEMLTHYIEWEHQSNVFVISPPMESVKEIANFLNMCVPGSVKFPSGISALLRNVEPRRYGWSMKKVLEFDSDDETLHF
jgi:general stress protein YciG